MYQGFLQQVELTTFGNIFADNNWRVLILYLKH